MSSETAVEGLNFISGLPQSAWLRTGVSDPDNAIAVFQKKGGTGKTSVTSMLVDAAARFGLNVLAVDGDPQGNLSLSLNSKVNLVDTGRTGLGGKRVLEPDRLTLVEVIDANDDGVVDEAVQPAGWEYDVTAEFTRGGPLVPGKMGTVGIVPSYTALEDVARGWNVADLGRLDRALNRPLGTETVAPRVRWDLVFTDMLPGGSDLARSELRAMRKYVLLTTAEPFGINAIADTLKFGQDTRDNWNNPSLQALGLVFTSYNPLGTVTRQELGDLREAQQAGVAAVDVEVWEPRVPTRTVVPRAQGFRAPMSALLAERQSREAATEMCQVAEAVLVQILNRINHPDAAEIEQRWREAWPKLSAWATGEIAEKEKKEARRGA